MSKLYFAYGSNLNLEQMHARCPSARPVVKGVLLDYRLRYAGGGHADVVPSKRKVVYGAVYQIDAEAEAALDQYEGVGGGLRVVTVNGNKHYYRSRGYYEKVIVHVRIGRDQYVECMTYVMVEGHQHTRPSEGYVLTCLIGMADWQLPVTGAVATETDRICRKRVGRDALDAVKAVWNETSDNDDVVEEVNRRSTGQRVRRAKK